MDTGAACGGGGGARAGGVLRVFVGYDNREAVAAKVLKHSIERHTPAAVRVEMLEHRALRSAGWFRRPWLIDPDTGNFRDLVDGKGFSTEFSHSRFLVPALMGYRGWALFLDCDMVFLGDIRRLWALRDDRYAVMCVKHVQPVARGEMKMDNRPNEAYARKNWSSFVLFNCGHEANRALTVDAVNSRDGGWLHRLEWLGPCHDLIGALPGSYNYISGSSATLPVKDIECIHYTHGGPWFEACRDVPHASVWMDAYEDWSRDADHGEPLDFPSRRFDGIERRRRRE